MAAQEGWDVAAAREMAVVVRALEVEAMAVEVAERATVEVARVPGVAVRVSGLAERELVGEVRAGEAMWVIATAVPCIRNKHPQQ